MKKILCVALLATFGWSQAAETPRESGRIPLSFSFRQRAEQYDDRISIMQQLHEQRIVESDVVTDAESLQALLDSTPLPISSGMTATERVCYSPVLKKLDHDFTLYCNVTFTTDFDNNGGMHVTPDFIEDINPVFTIKVTNPSNREPKDEKYKNSPLLLYVHNERANSK